MSAAAAEAPQAVEISNDFLQDVPIFGGLSDAECDRLRALARVQSFDTGDLIVEEGALARAMYVIIEGAVEILKAGRERAVCLLSPGDCIGEMALIDIQPRSATARATAPSRLLVLGFDDLIRIYEQSLPTYTLIVMNIAREISRRLRRANARIVELGADALPDP